MVIAEIRETLAALAAQPALFSAANFASRAEALDELEIHVIDRLDGLLVAGPSAALHRLNQQAEALKERLETIDRCLFRQLRGLIRAQQPTPDSLRALLATYAGPPDGSNPCPAAISYDHLDVLTNGLFIAHRRPLATQAREPEMVYYQKTPARIIWELATKITAQDIFYDLGSGLGQVPLLVRLLSGATAKGVEIEPAYCRYAQACAAALRLTRVYFLNADARSLAYADGTIFFLFTPFTGHILHRVLHQLRQVAGGKLIKIFSYGPGTQELARQPWLQRLDPPDSHLYQLAEFQSG